MNAATRIEYGADAERFQAELAAYLELRVRWAEDPNRYVAERIGATPTHQQRRLLDALAPDGAKVTVRSGHGTGKTSAIAWAIYWFLETRDYSRIPCTAPTAAQLRDVLWADLGLWMRRSHEQSQRRGDHPRLFLGALFRLIRDRLQDRSAPGEWFAAARTSSKHTPDALQGFHAGDVTISADGKSREDTEGADSGRLMFVVDEASGVPDGVFEVAEGALSGHGSRLIMAGNPVRTGGYFARSHGRDRHQFTPLHFRTSDSPLADPDYRARLVARWGEHSNIVRVRADGEFPTHGDDVLISLEWAESAINRDQHVESCETRVSVDPARFGDDRTVTIVRRGRNLLACEVAARQDTMTTCGRAIVMRQTYGAAGIWVGTAGFAGIADRLREQGEHVVEVNEGAGAPRERPWGHDDQMTPALVRDWMWLAGRAWLRDELPSFAGIDRDTAEELAGELATPRYSFDSSGRLKVESKDELKRPERLGRSPDLADALLISLYPDKARNQAPAVAGKTEF